MCVLTFQKVGTANSVMKTEKKDKKTESVSKRTKKYKVHHLQWQALQSLMHGREFAHQIHPRCLLCNHKWQTKLVNCCVEAEVDICPARTQSPQQGSQ